MTLFNFAMSKKTKDVSFPHVHCSSLGQVARRLCQVMENYTNQCTAKDRLVINLDMDDLSRAIGTFNNIVKEIKKNVDYEKVWMDYPAFLLHPDAAPEERNKRVNPPPTDATTPIVGVRGAGRGGSPGCGNGNAGRGGGRGTGRGGGVNTWGTGASFGVSSFDNTVGSRVCNDKGCYVLLGSTRDPTRTLCVEVCELYCAKYSTQGYFCCNPSCSLKHRWFNNYPADLQAKQLAHVKANKTMVLFSPDCHPTVTLLSDKHHLIAPSVQSPAPGEQ